MAKNRGNSQTKYPAARRKNNANGIAAKRAEIQSAVVGTSLTRESIQAQLEAEYCPPLDSALLSALIEDLPDFSPDTLFELRTSLRQLADSANVSLDFETTISIETDVSDVPFLSDDFESGSISASVSQPETSSSQSSSMSISSPINFLRLAFPHLPENTLETSLTSAQWTLESESEDPQINMGSVVETLLSEEYIRELTERGWDDESQHDVVNKHVSVNQDWEVIATAPNSTQRNDQKGNVDTNGLGPRKGKRIKPHAIQVVDLRQRQHAPASRTSSASSTPSPDPWSHFTSLASHLTTLVPTTTYNEFLALFHNPSYRTAGIALRAHLRNIGVPNRDRIDAATCKLLLELLPDFADEQEKVLRGDVNEDATVCLAAVDGRVEDALDLMLVLRDLDINGAIILHSLPGTPITAAAPAPPPLPMFPPSTPPPPIKSSAVLSSSKPSTKQKGGWQTVSRRVRPVDPEPEGLAAFIPAYRTTAKQKRWEASKEGRMGVFETDVDLRDAESCRRVADEYRRKRDTALRKASSHWQRGRLGGEIAYHYAEEARELESRSRAWAMRGARAQVQHTRDLSHNKNKIDLHGLTVRESIMIVKEGVNTWWSSAGSGMTPTSSLCIITGVGNHSTGPGVLAPAIIKMLQNDGWNAYKDHGQVIVTGLATRALYGGG